MRRKNIWSAECLLDEKVENEKKYYLVKWKGTDRTTGKQWEPTWEPDRNCSAALKKDWMLKQQSDNTHSNMTSTIETAQEPSQEAHSLGNDDWMENFPNIDNIHYNIALKILEEEMTQENDNLMEKSPNVNQNDEVRQSMNKRKATDISNNLIKQHKGYYEKTNTRYENLIKYLYSSNETVKMEMKTIQKNQILLKRELEISLSELENKKTHLKSLQEGYITQKSLLSIQKNQYELLDERFKRQNKKECEKINELQKDNVKILEEIERLKTYRESEGQSSSSDFLENENKNLQSQVYLLKAQCKLNEQRLKMPKELIKRHESTLRLLIDHKKIVSENNVQDKNLPIY
ncbi:18947_t:CDS:2 [Entrophospora sp. SA101]|nr:12988_t:CDS:2 [Entrophospora sp. SA101]CAJ0762839.1 18947_t:CDS:2 [Entrophospora sp. SA101]CAJ0845547.1 2512_t:CDS:2 [Entrophospora sp. SA101]